MTLLRHPLFVLPLIILLAGVFLAACPQVDAAILGAAAIASMPAPAPMATFREAFEGERFTEGQALAGMLNGLIDQRRGDRAAIIDELAKAAGIEADTVKQILDGKIQAPPMERLEAFAKVLDVKVDRLKSAMDSARMREAVAGDFLEAHASLPGRYLIRVIRGGISGNGNMYPDRVLREAAQRFEGVRVYAKSDAEHLVGGGKDVRNLIGGLSDPAFVEGKAGEPAEIHATLTLIEPEGAIGKKLREAWNRGLTGLFGFSIDARGPAVTTRKNGRTLREAQALSHIASVDLIVEPGAGGGVIRLIEAQDNKGDGMRDRMIRFIEAHAADLAEGKVLADLDDDQLDTLYREAIALKDGGEEGGSQSDNEGGGDNQDAAKRAVEIVERRARMREAVSASKLPDRAKGRVIDRFAEAETFSEADVRKAIEDELDYLADFTESGRVVELGDVSRIESGETRAEKTDRMLDAFFDPDDRSVRSFKECYVAITGDQRVTGMLRHCDEALMREALTTSSFDDVLGNSITRRMIADYRMNGRYDGWRRIATTTNANDFRTQERTRFGGYGDLPAVAEGAAYAALTSPTDEKATYAVTKRGGTETVTLEMIKNDDAGAIRRIPVALSRSAKRTLAKFAFDFLKDNPTIYDSVALFHASHGNLGAAALSGSTLAAGRLAMLKQTEKDSGDRLGIGPRSLVVPPDLEETAVDLFRRNTENDRTFTQSLSLDVIPVWYWTDANDWCLAADPEECPTIEIGFLDGQEEPEIFIQDAPTHGSMFTNDQLTWKIRHIYGGNVTEFRGLYKAVVA